MSIKRENYNSPVSEIIRIKSEGSVLMVSSFLPGGGDDGEMEEGGEI